MAPQDTNAITNELEEYFARMEQAKAPAWRPDPGTTVVGEVIGLSMREGDYGPYPVITYKVGDGIVINVHAFHTMLRERLAELKTDIGVVQVITYSGMRDKNKPNAKGEIERYHDYYVENYGESETVGKAADFTF
jgi:hypothetical protein